MKKSIIDHVRATPVNLEGALIDQPLPQDGLDQVDPFLLIHHWKTVLPGQQSPREVGVGPHPHRGFSPVTIILEGNIHHRDSRGNDQIVKQGGVQWMHSGMGIIHSERPDKNLAEEGGQLELIQFWVNVPARAKMSQPKYQPLASTEIPKIRSVDERILLSVIAGKYGGKTSPIHTESPLIVIVIEGKKGGEMILNIDEGFNNLIYVLQGRLDIQEEISIGAANMVVLSQEGQEVCLSFEEDGKALLLAGAPIDEPVKRYGPYVMNTQSEILRAIRDAQMGKMGLLIETFD